MALLTKGSEQNLQAITGSDVNGSYIRAGTAGPADFHRNVSADPSADRHLRVLDRRKRPPLEFVQDALHTGYVFPDENDPFDAAMFHGNFKGYEAGHKDQAARKQWFETSNQKLAHFKTWENVNIHEADADYAMKYGDHALGTPFPFTKMKPKLEQERDQMVASYGAALQVHKEKSPEAWEELVSNPAYSSSSSSSKPTQPDDTLEGVYRGCMESLLELWDVTERIAEAGGSNDVSWSLKKLLRCTKKLVEKYDGHPNQVTDIARTSIVFDSIESIEQGLKFALSHTNVVRLKNRFKEPELGYSDILLNAKMSTGFICEVQLHLRSVYYVKGSNGHRAFKWIRRLVRDNDMYEGERNEAGKRHGYGKWWGANGDVYDGQWVADMKHGHGVFTEAEGHKYVGTFADDKREGHCIFTYFDGSKYEGSYRNDKKHGYGIFSYADGQKYEGQWVAGKRHGKGSFTYADGSQYMGEWLHHARHGRGTFVDAQGVTTVATWRDDAPVKSFWSCWGPLQCCATETEHIPDAQHPIPTAVLLGSDVRPGSASGHTPGHSSLTLVEIATARGTDAERSGVALNSTVYFTGDSVPPGQSRSLVPSTSRHDDQPCKPGSPSAPLAAVKQPPSLLRQSSAGRVSAMMLDLELPSPTGPLGAVRPPASTQTKGSAIRVSSVPSLQACVVRETGGFSLSKSNKQSHSTGLLPPLKASPSMSFRSASPSTVNWTSSDLHIGARRRGVMF